MTAFVGIRMKQFKAILKQQAILTPEQRATFKSLSKFGAFVRRTAKTSMRKSKKSSPPGLPPKGKKGLLAKLIQFVVERTRRNVAIGPILTNAKDAGVVPKLHEEGGSKKLTKGDRVVLSTLLGEKEGRHVPLSEIDRQATYPARPYMKPAFDKELGEVSSLWLNSIRP